MMSADDAMELGQAILDLCQEVPDAGEEFAASIEEKVASIMEWVEQHDEVTAAQAGALQNMQRGVQRWVR